MTRSRALLVLTAVAALLATALYVATVPGTAWPDESFDEAAGVSVEAPEGVAVTDDGIVSDDEARVEQGAAIQSDTDPGLADAVSVETAEQDVASQPAEEPGEAPADMEPALDTDPAVESPTESSPVEAPSAEPVAEPSTAAAPVAEPAAETAPIEESVEDVSLKGVGFDIVDPLSGIRYSISADSGQSYYDAVVKYFNNNGWPEDTSGQYMLDSFNFQKEYKDADEWNKDYDNLQYGASDGVTLYFQWIKKIDTVTLDVVKPIKDQPASTAPIVTVPAGAQYMVVDAYWTDKTALPYTPLTGTLEACTPHLACVTLDTRWGYGFDVVNGGPAVESNIDNRVHVQDWSCEGSGTELVLLYCDFDHVLVHHDAKAGTATTPGSKEYWECKECGKWFWDENAYEPIADKSEVVAKWLFEDCPPDAWFMTEGGEPNGWVGYVVAKGMMTGYGEPDGTFRRFGPNDPITRAQVVTILHRWGNPTSKDTLDENHYAKTSIMADVPANMYYTAAINAAYYSGIVTGYGDTGLFMPDRNITREELATIIYRFAGKIKGPGSATMKIDMAQFNALKDKDDVSAWAHDAVAWCVDKGIMGATGYAKPQDNTTRAEAAKMLGVLVRDIL